MQKNWFIYSLTSLLTLPACNPVPSDILSQNEMRVVLTDMQIADCIIYGDRDEYKDHAKRLALYESVFRKHNITQAKYDSSLNWYAKNLDIYMRVYNLVSKDVDKRIADLGDVEKIELSAQKNDSINIWSRRNHLTFSPTENFNGTTFNINPKESYPSGSSFTLGMKIWGIQPNMKNKPEIRICADQGDTTIIVNDKISKDGYFQTTLQSIATKRVKRFYGFIRLDNKDMDYHKIYTDSISLIRYNYKSTGFTDKGLKPQKLLTK